MPIITQFNVERVTRNGTALYLDIACEWTTDAEAAFAYDDEAEAHADADKHGGEVFKFQRWSPDRGGYSEAARLEQHFSMAAE